MCRVCVCVCVCVWCVCVCGVCVCAVNFNVPRPPSPCLSDGRVLPLPDALTLVSQVTSALQPLDATVHHLHSAGGDTSITVSQLLLGLPQPEPVARISAALDGVVKRVYEVIGIRVQGAASLCGPLGGGGRRNGRIIQRVRGGQTHL